MERRVYFILGDLLACAVAGAAGGWIAYLAVPAAWHFAIGMAIGMVVGMLAGLVVAIILSPFFGVFELIMPASLSGMLGGMWAGMQQAMSGIGPTDAASNGVLAGVLCLAFVYVLQARLHGEAKL